MARFPPRTLPNRGPRIYSPGDSRDLLSAGISVYDSSVMTDSLARRMRGIREKLKLLRVFYTSLTGRELL